MDKTGGALHPLQLPRVHLARRFRARLGCTYGDYVRRVRLVRALEQLRRSSRPIVEIAAETGFADQSHLSRLMTAFHGIAPAAYRRERQVVGGCSK